MATKRRRRGTARVRKNMDMDPAKLRAVKEMLGAKSETEAVDRALDAVLGKARVRAAMKRLRAAGGLHDVYAARS